MKKNNMLRLASVLLVAVLLSTCAISGVFAHYYTDAAADDSARVAKWGVYVTAAADAFEAKYDVEDTDNKTVASANGTDLVVAPGTEGTLAEITVTGKPEVDVKVTKTANLTLTGWDINGDAEGGFYCPIVITVGTTPFDGTGFNDAASFEAAVEEAILGDNYVAATADADATASYDVDNNIDLAGTYNTTVEWKWAFDTNKTNDTKLGNLDVAPTISIDVSVAVEQVGD